jgi:transposase
MEKIKEVVGIDISKLTLDVHLHRNEDGVRTSNDYCGIEDMIKWMFSKVKTPKEEILFVFENTGLYTYPLIEFLHENNYLFHVASGLQIKRSLGITRGKEDKADAKRIARYGYRMREEIELYKKPSNSLAKLKRLLSLRKKLVGQRAGYISTLKEQKRILDSDQEMLLFTTQQEIISTLDEQISLIEKEIEKIIQEDQELQNQYRLLLSIKGIGGVTAQYLIVQTSGFTAFKSWRKFASYCGIAPFPNQSGTSIRGKTKVSRLAQKESKTLLTLCATTAIQFSPEMKAFYERRVEMGKNKMSTINIIRNKLLARAFAVIKRGTPYVNTMKFAS